jgi:hypothetical protein
MRATALLSTIAFLALTNCSSETPVDIFDISGGVTGTVRTASGAPVAGAVITGTAAYPLAGSAMPITDSAQTGADGHYALRFITLNLADAEVPVSLTVRPPVTSGLLELDTSGFSVPIARSGPNPIRVDLVLSAYQPTAEHLVGEFSGRAGADFKAYDLFLAVDEVADSVRGVWSLAFVPTCSTHDGQFSGTLQGSELRLRLRPDGAAEATLDIVAHVLPGDTLIAGDLSLVQVGGGPLCYTIFDPFTLHYGDVVGLPVGR